MILNKTKYKLKKIWNLPVKNIHLNKKIIYNMNTFVPKKWQVILMSDGSLTQNLISLKGQMINLEIINCFAYQDIQNYIREVILVDKKNIGLTFARSAWPIYRSQAVKNSILDNKPIGQSLIEDKIDIYKDIHEIYYGYCIHLESKFQFNGPIWGRKYTIYHERKPLTTIQEIFSKKLIHLIK